MNNERLVKQAAAEVLRRTYFHEKMAAEMVKEAFFGKALGYGMRGIGAPLRGAGNWLGLQGRALTGSQGAKMRLAMNRKKALRKAKDVGKTVVDKTKQVGSDVAATAGQAAKTPLNLGHVATIGGGLYLGNKMFGGGDDKEKREGKSLASTTTVGTPKPLIQPNTNLSSMK